MFFHHSPQPNIRRHSLVYPSLGSRISRFALPARSQWQRQWVRRVHHLLRRVSLLGPRVLWLASIKVVLVFAVLFLGMNLWLSSVEERVAVSRQAVEEGRALILDEHIALKAERARLLSPAHLNEMVADRLALYAPEKEQVIRF
jgi:hypothetical protein